MMRAILFVLVLAGCAHAQPEFERPHQIRFGDTLDEIRASLEGQCESMRVRRIEPPFLANVRVRQMQIDCDGYDFRGGERHVEFVFRDDRLAMVWLMVNRDETQAMIDAMTGAYGAPTGRNSAYVAFEGARAAWRFEPAEILFWAPELDEDVRPDFR